MTIWDEKSKYFVSLLVQYEGEDSGRLPSGVRSKRKYPIWDLKIQSKKKEKSS